MASSDASPNEEFLKSLEFPDESALKAFGYFTPDVWPTISKVIQDFLKGKEAFNSVTPMIHKDSNRYYHPWIIVRIIPQPPETAVMHLDQEIGKVLLENGFGDPIYSIHIEYTKRAPRPGPIDTGFKEEKYRELPADLAYSHPARDAIPTPRRLSVTGELPNIADPKIGAAIRASQKASERTRSVKHLTCWYWLKHQKGCLKSEKECLYAHRDTGRYAEQPRIVVPGGPRLAGRNASRLQDALRQTYKGYGENEYVAVGSAALGRKGKERAQQPAVYVPNVQSDFLYGRASRSEPFSPGHNISEVPASSKTTINNNPDKGSDLKDPDISHIMKYLVVGVVSAQAEAAAHQAVPTQMDSDQNRDDDVVVAGPSRSAPNAPSHGDETMASNIGTHGSNVIGREEAQQTIAAQAHVSFAAGTKDAAPANTPAPDLQDDEAPMDGVVVDRKKVRDGKRRQKKRKSAALPEAAAGIMDPEKTINDTRTQLRRANNQLILGAREFCIGHDLIFAHYQEVLRAIGATNHIIDEILPYVNVNTHEYQIFKGIRELMTGAQNDIKRVDDTWDRYENRAWMAMQMDSNADSVFEWWNYINPTYDAEETIAAAPKHAADAIESRRVELLEEQKLAEEASKSKGKERAVYKDDPLVTDIYSLEDQTVAGPSAAAQASIIDENETGDVTMSDIADEDADSEEEGGVEIDS